MQSLNHSFMHMHRIYSKSVEKRTSFVAVQWKIHYTYLFLHLEDNGEPKR